MIVTENRESNEVTRFFVLDAFAKLGIVQAGSEIRSFDPTRLLRYYALVENQLFDYSSRYPDSFQYLPRRAYSYLSKPPLLGDVFESLSTLDSSSWFADQFLILPLTEISGAPLPKYQQRANLDSCQRWAARSEYSSRIYNAVDLRMDLTDHTGWASSIDAQDISMSLQGPNRQTILQCVGNQIPILVRFESKSNIPSMLEWLVHIRESGLPAPSILFSVKSHRKWEEDILKLVQMPNAKILTCGATIGSLSSLIKALEDFGGDMHWSEKVVFGSAYPETQQGDSVTEIISFLLSRNLNATHDEIQRVLGGNMLSVLSPIMDEFGVHDSYSSVFVEGSLGKTALREIFRLLKILTAQQRIHLVSANMITENSGGKMDFNSLVLGIKNVRRKKTSKIALWADKNDALGVSGWKRAFDDILKTEGAAALQASIRASDKDQEISSPSNLPAFNRKTLKIMGINDAEGVLSSLHYNPISQDIPSGTVRICEQDAHSLGVGENDIVTALDADSNHYWGVYAKVMGECPNRGVIVPSSDALLYGLTESSQLDLIKYNDDVVDSDEVLLTYRGIPGFTDAELATRVHMLDDEIRQITAGKLVGVGSRFVTSPGIELVVSHLASGLDKGKLARIMDANVSVIPFELLNSMNLLLIVASGNEVRVRDVEIKTPSTLREYLRPLTETVIELGDHIASIGRVQTRWDISELLSLAIIRSMKHNESEGRLGVVFVDRNPHKFTVQKGQRTQDFLSFDDDLQNDDVYKSLLYSIMDAGEISSDKTSSAALFRSLAEMVEDVGLDLPTLAIMITPSLEFDESIKPYLQAMKSVGTAKLLILGVGGHLDRDSIEQVSEWIDIDFRDITAFSLFQTLGMITSEIRDLCHS
jgi:hypothetical protein